MTPKKNNIMQIILELGEKSCLVNILDAYNMGPMIYDIITPAPNKTLVYIDSSHEVDLEKDSDYLEKSLKNLLDFLESKISQNKLLYKPFVRQNRRKSSDYDVELIISDETQKRYKNLSQGWILPV